MNSNLSKKIVIFFGMGLILFIAIFTMEKKYQKKIEPPEWMAKFEKYMIQTEQEIKVDDYCIKLVGVYYNNNPGERNTENNNEVEYICKFEVTNPNIDMKECLAEKTNVINEISPWFGKNHDMRIVPADETGYLANNTYYILDEDILYIYSYLSVQKSDDLVDKDYYSTWSENIYLQMFPAKSHRDGYKDMAGVFNLNIAGKIKKYKYEKANLAVYLTEQNIYFNGDENVDIDSLILHMDDGTTKNVSDEMQIPKYPDDEFEIYNYGTYNTDEHVKTFTSLIHFSEGTDIDNIDYIELNKNKLEEIQ